MTDRTEPTAVEMVEDVIGLVAGAVTAMLPFFILSVPGLILLVPVLVPLVVAGLLAGVVAALVAPPYLLVRRLVRGRAGA